MIEQLRPLLDAVDALVHCEHPRMARQTSAVGAARCSLCGAQREAGGEWELPERLNALARQAKPLEG